MEVATFPYSSKGVKHVVFDSSSGGIKSPIAETKSKTSSSLRPQTAVNYKKARPQKLADSSVYLQKSDELSGFGIQEISQINPQTSTHYELECQIAKIHNIKSMYEDPKKSRTSKSKQTSIVKRQKVVR